MIEGTTRDTDITLYGKLAPQALDLEEAVIGAILLDRSAFGKVNMVFTGQQDYFYSPTHEMIYQACYDLAMNSKPIDILTVSEKLKSLGNLDSIGGYHTLMELTNKVSSSANIEYHAQILKQKKIARDLITASYGTLKDAYDEQVDVLELLDKTQLEILDIQKQASSSSSGSMMDVIKRMEESMSRAKKNTGISGIPFTPDHGLNLTLDGAENGDLIVIASRPGMGKSIFASACVEKCYDLGLKPAIWHLEMTKEKAARRMIAHRGKIPHVALKSGEIEEYRAQYNKALEMLLSGDITMEDKVGVTVLDIRSTAIRWVSEGKCDILFIDHGGLIKKIGKGNEEEQLGFITNTLKKLAKELNVPIVLLWQLSREVERRGGDKRPQLSDLRGTGRLEEDGDKIVFLYRPEYYNFDTIAKRSPHGTGLIEFSSENILECLVRKQREGEIRDHRLYFDKEFMRIREMTSFDY